MIRLSLVFILILEFILTQNLQNFSNQAIPYLKSSKRSLQINKCKIYDDIYSDICKQCEDSYSLPDCTKCPIGTTDVGDVCKKCPKGSLNCDDTTNELYCFLGFTQVDKECTCNPPKRLTYGNEKIKIHFQTLAQKPSIILIIRLVHIRR